MIDFLFETMTSWWYITGAVAVTIIGLFVAVAGVGFTAGDGDDSGMPLWAWPIPFVVGAVWPLALLVIAAMWIYGRLT